MQSQAIDIDGRFVGAAVRQAEGFRFVALDIRLDELDGSLWPNLTEMRRHLRALAAVAESARRQGTTTH